MVGRITLPPQIWTGSQQPQPQLLRPALTDQTHWKPRGGLWTSSHTPEEPEPSAWLSWCAAEDFRLDRQTELWLLQPASALVYVVETLQDVADLIDQFALRLPPDLAALRLLRDLIDWAAFAQQYEAVWYPDPRGLYWASSTNSMLLYSLDCESTWWTRWSFRGQPQRL